MVSLPAEVPRAQRDLWVFVDVGVTLKEITWSDA